MLEHYISIPSSLAQTLSIEDKNLRVREDGPGKDRRSFIVCRGCGGRAENDEYDSIDKTGNKCRIRVARCIEKSKCLPYKEVLSDKKDENNMSIVEQSEKAEFKVDLQTVKKYCKLNRKHKEEIAKGVGMSSKYVGFALRRSENRKLLTKREVDDITLAVILTYDNVRRVFNEGDAEMNALYAGVNLDTVDDVQLLEEEMLGAFESSPKLEIASEEECELLAQTLQSLHTQQASVTDNCSDPTFFLMVPSGFTPSMLAAALSSEFTNIRVIIDMLGPRAEVDGRWVYFETAENDNEVNLVEGVKNLKQLMEDFDSAVFEQPEDQLEEQPEPLEGFDSILETILENTEEVK